MPTFFFVIDLESTLQDQGGNRSEPSLAIKIIVRQELLGVVHLACSKLVKILCNISSLNIECDYIP